MKLFLVGLWAVLVTLGAGYAVAAFQLGDTGKHEGPHLEGLRYTSMPTMSIPVIEEGGVTGYVVVRMVYTADAAVLRALSVKPDAFLADEIFRTFYSRSETKTGRLVRLDLEELAETARKNVNERMGDDVVEDLLVDGLNYIDAGTAGQGAAIPAPTMESAHDDGLVAAGKS